MTVADVLSTATQQQVAKIYQRIGMDPRSLGRIDVRHVAPWIKDEVAAVLGVPAGELFGRTEE
jgi:hypothetical protein